MRTRNEGVARREREESRPRDPKGDREGSPHRGRGFRGYRLKDTVKGPRFEETKTQIFLIKAEIDRRMRVALMEGVLHPIAPALHATEAPRQACQRPANAQSPY